MSAVAEFFFRPRNHVHRLLARMIGAPTCGVLRSGPLMQKHGDPYEVAVAFCARDHHNAELEAFPSSVARPSDMRDGCKELRKFGLRAWFSRRDTNGSVIKKVRL